MNSFCEVKGIPMVVQKLVFIKRSFKYQEDPFLWCDVLLYSPQNRQMNEKCLHMSILF